MGFNNIDYMEKIYRVIGTLICKPEYKYINNGLIAGIAEDAIKEYEEIIESENNQKKGGFLNNGI